MSQADIRLAATGLPALLGVVPDLVDSNVQKHGQYWMHQQLSVRRREHTVKLSKPGPFRAASGASSNQESTTCGRIS